MSNASSVKKAPVLSGAEEAAGRARGAKPQLLAQLPGSMFTSPGFILGIVAFEFLYALFLFAVMSSSKRERHDAGNESLAYVEPAPVIPRPTPPPEPPPSSSNEKKENTPVVLKAEEKLAKPAPAAVVAKEPAAPKVKPKKNSKKGRGKAKSKRQVAAVTPAAPAPPPPPAAPVMTFGPLGALIDPLHDTQVSADGDGVTLKVPGKAHIFDPKAAEKTAPRALTEVEGDFTVQVKVLGNLQPGTDPLNKNVPFTFQGAGILVWQDNGNYLRVERTASFTRERLRQIRVESCKDGKPGGSRPVSLRNEAPIILRLERRGSEVAITYSYDGKSWLPVVKSLAVSFPAKVSVGISASNLSPKPLSARFEQFVLTQ